MNITELDSYNLADAVKFNDQLNPRLWDASEHLRPEVRDHLLQIADDFRESLGVTDLELKDITISGSNAAYTYTPHSDIDLHLVVDLPTADHNEVYRELFDAKKYQYNDEHNIRIGNADVELYVENANQPPKSQGIYSILQNKWLQVPRRGRADIDDNSTKNKYQTLSRQIQSAIKSGSVQKISNLVTKIRKMRQTSLDQHGEFGAENLAFKILRSQGAIDQLYAARNRARDQELSLAEQVPKQPFVYGFKQVHEASTPDGVSPQTKMFLSEEPPADDETVLQDFVDFCVQELQIDSPPTIKLRRDPQWSVVHRTFGRYTNDRNRLEVAWGQRHIMDVLRTVAHELTHRHQHERDGSRMGPDAGETGSPWENEANAQAGVLMRDYGRLHPELFDSGQEDVVEQQTDPQRREPQNESASGYIPTKRQARDPRYSMALSVDIHPGQVGKEANKLKLKTDRQGRPQIARADGLFEQLMMELEQFQTLDEVRMAPADLKRFAASPAAEGIRAGFEAELVFTGRGEPELEMEPDYHYDERAYSISQVIEFFSNDEAGLGMSQNRANRLERELDESYMEWHDEQLRSEFQDEQHSLIRDAKLARMDMDERILNVLTETDGFTEEEADAIVDLHWQQTRQGLKGSEMTDQQIDWRSKYNEAKRTAEAVLEDEVQESIDSNDDIYQQVLDEFRNSFELDDSNFFSDIGLRYMSDVANNYNLSWPYITQTGGEGGWSDENAKILADSLAKKLGVTTRASTNYHSATRDDSTWILEPDTSLEPDDESNMAIEIITPPMPLAECLTKMEQFFAWADSMGAYANESTGFHMGVSLPDDKNAGVDFTKLVLFLGDEHVLKQFERDANTYCRSAMQKIRNRVEHHPERAGDALNLMRNHMMELAHRTIVDNSGFGKYTSVNPKGNYIEFRSAGNTNYFEDIDQLKNTLLRYARAMSIASDPAAERKEYGKKLYKLLAPSRPDPAMALFSKFAAGELSQDELKTQWAELALIKEKNKELEWEAYDPVTGLVLGTAQGSDPSKILSYFTNTMNLNNFKVRTKQSKPSARSELANRIIQQLGPDKPGNWFFYRDGRYLGQIDGTKGQAEAERKKWALNLGINVNQVIMTKSPDSIRGQLGEPRPAFASQTPREPPPNPTPRSRWPFDEPESQPDVAQNFPDTQLTVQGVPNWELYDRRTNEVVRTFFQRDSTSALNYATQWLNTNRPGVPLGNFNVRPTPATNESVGLTESARWPDIESAKRAFVANPRLQHLPVSKRSAMGAAAYLKQQSSSGDLISKLKTPPAKSWQDVDETINNAMFQGSWEKQEHRDGLDLKAEASTRGLSIRAYDADGRMIGQAHFDIVDDHLESFDTYVDRRYRRQGIATAMYNWAKELGNDIVASPDRLPDGKKFWTGSRRGTKTWENYEI